MEGSTKETIIIVHGTWAAPEAGKVRWYQPADGVPNDGFAAKLNAALEKRGSVARCWAHCTQDGQFFHWSGENSWIARTCVASALAEHVAKLRTEGWCCHIIAHSHGGNIVLEALPQIIAAPSSSDERKEKIVTLGTPFMDTMSPVLEQGEWRQKNVHATSLILLAMFVYVLFDNFIRQSVLYALVAIAWGALVFGSFVYRELRRLRRDGYYLMFGTAWQYWILQIVILIIVSVIIWWLWITVGLLWANVDFLLTDGFGRTSIDWWGEVTQHLAILFVLVALLRIAYRVRRRLGRTDFSGLWRTIGEMGVGEEQPAWLAIGSRMDEAWQILHHLRSIANPLAVKSSLFVYLFSSVRAAISQRAAVDRIFGAKSYRDIGTVAKLATASMHLLTVVFAVLAVHFYYSAVTCIEVECTETIFGKTFWINVLIVGFMIPIIVSVLAGVTLLFGDSVLSAFWSPFRACAKLTSALIGAPREIGTYLMRRKGWSVLLKVAMGLEGYRLPMPSIEQFPRNATVSFVRYENMPADAEQRALTKRSDWVARRLGDVSQTFSKLAITAADITLLLRTVEEDQALVHAAYYTDDECIARIADWIANRR